ncbi:MAG: BON domain-containing protein [Chloroflexi bacterium]|nr:BON domain-containing protein [Chloroflexota bacterium]
MLNALLSDPEINASGIDVVAKDDTMILQGSIGSYAERDAVKRDASQISGVGVVVDELEVRLPPEPARTDADLVGAARDALKWSTQVPDERLSVTARWGRLTLCGEVRYAYQREAATDAVSSLTGVSGVDNQIRVTPSVSADEVKQRVEEALVHAADTDVGDIQVDAADGTVTLHGTVHSQAERDVAEWTAWATHGVNEVLNELTVVT